VKQLLDQLHIEKAIIAGESMGGYVALAFLEKYPNRVEGLVLSDTQSIADTAEMKIKRETAAKDVLEHGADNFIKSFFPKALSVNASYETKEFLLKILKSQKTEAIASALRGMALRHDTSHVLANASIPVLIISGEEDSLISPNQSNKMHELTRNSKLVILQNAGHLSSLEQPEMWNSAVIRSFSSAP
jgi:pimeloyl-ACP methyl ester carboxylesterase